MNKEEEIETVTLMVRRYYRSVHGTRGGTLCPACAALLEYARERRDRCPHGEIDSHARTQGLLGQKCRSVRPLHAKGSGGKVQAVHHGAEMRGKQADEG